MPLSVRLQAVPTLSAEEPRGGASRNPWGGVSCRMRR